MERQTLGFIGLGNMGRPMVDHLMGAGHALRVYARRPDVMQPFVTRGAVACASPAEAVRARIDWKYVLGLMSGHMC